MLTQISRSLKRLLNGAPHRSRIARQIKRPEFIRRLGMSLADWIIYHQEKIHFRKMTWMGVKILKNPMDCWIYQELLHEVRPDVLVELGSLAGGSTLFFCHLFDLLGHGRVVSVDIDRSRFHLAHPRLTCITGDCAAPETIAQVAQQCAGRRALFVHDADHSKAAVLRDLENYAEFVSVGSYFVIEDGIVDVFGGRAAKRLRWDGQPGPLAAVREFLRQDSRFEIDHERERYVITANPSGFLRRVR